jgi:hypothetical protein
MVQAGVACDGRQCLARGIDSFLLRPLPVPRRARACQAAAERRIGEPEPQPDNQPARGSCLASARRPKFFLGPVPPPAGTQLLKNNQAEARVTRSVSRVRSRSRPTHRGSSFRSRSRHRAADASQRLAQARARTETGRVGRTRSEMMQDGVAGDDRRRVASGTDSGARARASQSAARRRLGGARARRVPTLAPVETSCARSLELAPAPETHPSRSDLSPFPAEPEPAKPPRSGGLASPSLSPTTCPRARRAARRHDDSSFSVHPRHPRVPSF